MLVPRVADRPLALVPAAGLDRVIGIDREVVDRPVFPEFEIKAGEAFPLVSDFGKNGRVQPILLQPGVFLAGAIEQQTIGVARHDTDPAGLGALGQHQKGQLSGERRGDQKMRRVKDGIGAA